MSFKIHGASRIGADGIGLWYKKGTDFSGDKTFGGPGTWTGLLIALDTFDNTNGRNSPRIIGLFNDGAQEYNSGDNGKALTIGSCAPNFRGRKYEVYVSYDSEMKRLDVKHKPADTTGIPKECFSANIELPPGYFFGMSAATGGLSDNHDVTQFIVTDYSSSEFVDMSQDDVINKDEKIKSSRKNLFEGKMDKPVDKYRNDKYEKIENLENQIGNILTNEENKIKKVKREIVDNVQSAIKERARAMLDDANYKEDVRKVNEYKNKIAKMENTVKYLSESMNTLSKSFANAQQENIGRIKSKSSHTFIIFIVAVQVVVGYIFFSWKNVQKKTNDNYLGFY